MDSWMTFFFNRLSCPCYITGKGLYCLDLSAWIYRNPNIDQIRNSTFVVSEAEIRYLYLDLKYKNGIQDNDDLVLDIRKNRNEYEGLFLTWACAYNHRTLLKYEDTLDRR